MHTQYPAVELAVTERVDAHRHRVIDRQVRNQQFGDLQVGDHGTRVDQGQHVGVEGHEVADFHRSDADQRVEWCFDPGIAQARLQYPLLRLRHFQGGVGAQCFVVGHQSFLLQAADPDQFDGGFAALGNGFVQFRLQQGVIERQHHRARCDAVPLVERQRGDTALFLVEDPNHAPAAKRAGVDAGNAEHPFRDRGQRHQVWRPFARCSRIRAVRVLRTAGQSGHDDENLCWEPFGHLSPLRRQYREPSVAGPKCHFPAVYHRP